MKRMNKKGSLVGSLLTLLLIGLYIFAWFKYTDQMTDVHGKAINWVGNKALPLLDKMFANIDQPSPGDRVRESQIKVYKDRVIIEQANVVWTKFTDTKSMDPFIDSGSNGLEIEPKDKGDIMVGDIISYKNEGDIIIHRVVKIGKDDEGWYVECKGDNNRFTDPERVRWEQIQGVVIGVIY